MGYKVIHTVLSEKIVFAERNINLFVKRPEVLHSLILKCWSYARIVNVHERIHPLSWIESLKAIYVPKTLPILVVSLYTRCNILCKQHLFTSNFIYDFVKAAFAKRTRFVTHYPKQSKLSPYLVALSLKEKWLYLFLLTWKWGTDKTIDYSLKNIDNNCLFV